MQRKFKIGVFFLAGLFIIILTFRFGLFRTSQNDIVQLLNKILIGDQMIIETSNEIDQGKLRINLAFTDKIVYEKSNFLDNIGKHHGGPEFDVYYDNNLIGRTFHFNTNDWYTNEYIFNFYKEKKQIKFKFKCNGRDSGGGDGYIYIIKRSDSLYFESYESNGNLINKWKV